MSDQVPNPDRVVAAFLKQRGAVPLKCRKGSKKTPDLLEFRQTEAQFRSEAQLKSSEALLEEAARQRPEASVPDFILFYNETEANNPNAYEQSYARLRKWIEDSIDKYKIELRPVLYPIFVHAYLDLLSKGLKEQARHFMENFKGDHVEQHGPDLQRISAIAEPQHVKENELAQTYRDNKYAVRVSKYSFELLLSFLQDNRFGLLLRIINEYISILVAYDKPSGSPEAEEAGLGLVGQNAAQLDTFNRQPVVLGQLPPDLPFTSEVEKILKEEGGEEAEALLYDLAKVKEEPTLDSPSRDAVPIAPRKLVEARDEIKALKDARARVKLSPSVLPSICCYTFHNTYESLNCATVSADASTMAAGFSESFIRVWSLDPTKSLGGKSKDKGMGNCLMTEAGAWSVIPDQFTGYDSGPRNAKGENELTQVLPDSAPLESGYVYKCCVYFATASHDKTARLWSCDHIYPLRIFAGHLSDVDTVKFHPNCNYVLTGSSDKTARLWDIQRGSCVRLFTKHLGAVHTLAISPDGRTMASSGEDKQIMLWDMGSGKRIKTMTGHTGMVYSLDFSKDGSVIASGGADNTVRLWDVKKGDTREIAIKREQAPANEWAKGRETPFNMRVRVFSVHFMILNNALGRHSPYSIMKLSCGGSLSIHILNKTVNKVDDASLAVNTDNVLELVEFDAASCSDIPWQSISEQHIFGTIKDVKPCRLGNQPLSNVAGDEDLIIIDDDEEAHGSMLEAEPYGPDVLVCLSDSGRLTFVTFSMEPPNEDLGGNRERESTVRRRGRFCPIFELPISDPGMNFDQLGHILTVDPLSRAIAVAAFQNVIRLWPVEPLVSNRFHPIDKSVDIYEDGVIMNMEFLYPFDADDSKIYFVVTISKQRAILMLRKYLKDKDMHCFNTSCFTQQEKPMRLPPLPTSVEQRDGALVSATAIRKPAPTEGASSQQELYLASEDGHIFNLTIDMASREVFYRHVHDCKHSIMSLAMLLTDDEGEHMVVFGELCDGEVIQVAADGVVTVKAAIPNWAPILDFQLADVYNDGHDSMYITSGNGPRGTVREICPGVGVSVLTSSPDYHGVTGVWNLKYRPEDQFDSFLAISFVAETKLMYLGEGEFEDVSEMSGLDIHRSALIVASLDVAGFIVQVHREKVVVAKPKIAGVRSERWRPPPGTTIAVAGVMENLVVVSISPQKALLLLKVLADEESGDASIVEMKQVTLDSEPCSIFCPSLRTPSHGDLTRLKICIIGTHKPALKVISLDSATPLKELHEESLGHVSTEGINMAQSFALIKNGREAFLLVGIRDGTVAAYRWMWNDVQLAANHDSREEAPPFVVAFSGRPFRIRFDADEGLELTDISFAQVSHGTPFSFADWPNAWMFIAKQSLFAVQLCGENKFNLRSISVEHTPRRILYDSLTRNLLVGTTKKVGSNFVSEILVGDPESEKRHTKEVLADNEVVCSLTVWNVKEGKRYITVGTWGYRETPQSAPQSRVLVYNLKAYERTDTERKGNSSSSAKPLFKLKRLGDKVLPGRLHAVCSFMNSCGKQHIVPAQNRRTEQEVGAAYSLVIGTQIELRWPIYSLSTHGNRIAVGGERESVSFYTYNMATKKFEFLKSDRYSRLTADCLAIDENTAIGTDKFGNIFGLVTEEPGGLEHTMNTPFTFHLGEAVMRLRLGSLVYRPTTDTEPAESPSAIAHANRIFRDESGLDLGWDLDESGGALDIMGISRSRSGAPIASRVIIPALGAGDPRGYIDGELVSQFLDLQEESQDYVTQLWNEIWERERPAVASKSHVPKCLYAIISGVDFFVALLTNDFANTNHHTARCPFIPRDQT
ncbi:Transcription initiation factor TFIID subunit 5 [Borealophlyctis nickersoniae]|nr:Transcription initiation factor TFIID subunit 5 [Borealophlyctis nickersoniae]